SWQFADFIQEVVHPLHIPQQEPIRKIRTFVALIGTLAGAVGFETVAVEKAVEFQQLEKRAVPMQIEQQVGAVPASKGGVPKRQEYDQDRDAAQHGCCKLLSPASHTQDDHG